MFTRLVIDHLKTWKHSSNRKPLILRGTRQAGKTTVVELFLRGFDQYIYLNLETEEGSQLFRRNLPVKELLQAILLAKNKMVTKGHTLLFIDEIQNSLKAIQMMRYFYESVPELYVT